MYKSCSYCCNSCWKNPIFYIFLLKKKFSKKNFCSKKIKKSKLVNFRFQLDRKLGFRVRAKNCKIEKAGRTLPTGMLLPAYQGALPFPFPALEASRSLCLMSHQRWVIRNDSSLMTHPWWLIRRRLLKASKAGKGKGKVIKIFVLPGVYKRFCRRTPAQFPFDSQTNNTSREELFLGRQVEAPLWAKFYLLSQFCSFWL